MEVQWAAMEAMAAVMEDMGEDMVVAMVGAMGHPMDLTA